MIRRCLIQLGLMIAFVGQAVPQSIEGVVNSYAKVVDVSETTLTVTHLNGKEEDFSLGKKVLIIQMKGAVIDRTNTVTYGEIADLSNAGNYEYTFIKEKFGSGSTYTLTLHHLLKTYDPTDFVQIVTVPQFEDATISDKVIAKPWDRITGTGGVVALEVNGTLTLGADIDVSGQGFVGGSPNLIQYGGSTDVTTFVTDSQSLSGQKGEGIAAYGAEGMYGMGPLANGGGGGNNHNAGGGGGGNFSSGGAGGQSYYGPGGEGLPGKKLNPSENKIFMGGGGGGGQQNDNHGAAGGAGGGIIIIRAGRVVTDCTGATRLIAANGADGYNATGNDGAGGGGAAGSILLEVESFDLACEIKVQTNGGKGGSVLQNEKHAGGGGGGAGAIRIKSDIGNPQVTFASIPGEAGLDCSGSHCTSTGTSGEICSGDACSGDEPWEEFTNTQPIAQNDNAISYGEAIQIAVLGNDFDTDFNNVLTVSSTLLKAPENGSLSLTDNVFTYTPNDDFLGHDSFEYQICDNAADPLCSQAVVYIKVKGVRLKQIEGEALTFSEGQEAIAVTHSITIDGVGISSLNKATITISGNYLKTEDLLSFTDTHGIIGTWDVETGTLSLSGNASLAHYRSALRSVTYENINGDNPSGAAREVSIRVSDGELTSNTVTREIMVIPVNDAPELSGIETDALVFTEGDAAKAVSDLIAVADVDDENLSGATVTISGNYLKTEDLLSFTDTHGIIGTWDVETGTLSLSGNASLAHYRSALRSVTYENTNSNNPSGAAREVSIRVNDGELTSNTVTREITVIPVNDAPELSGIETDALSFTEGDAAKSITASLDVTDVDNENFSGATVTISSNYQKTEDLLSFIGIHGIIGTWDVETGTLSLSGNASLAHYRSALRSVTYENTNSNNPSGAAREVSIRVSDGELTSNTVTREITVIPVNDAPELSGIETDALSFTEGDAAKAVYDLIAVADVDDENLSGATITISGNYLKTEDLLSFTDTHGIIGTWDVETGTLSLSGNASLAHYRSALRSVTYRNTNGDNPSGATREVSFSISDGELTSNIVKRDITVIPVNDAPELSGIETDALVFTEGDAAKSITSSLEVADVDNITLSGATVTISGNYLKTEDLLSFTDTHGIIGTWDVETGTLSLSGNASLAHYRSALRSVTYRNTNGDNPSGATREVSIRVSDGELTSNTVTREITVIPVNDAPVTQADIAVTDKNVAVVIAVLENDYDVENDILTTSAFPIIPPTHGAIEVNANNTIIYTPDFNFFGTDSFTYEVCDSGDPTECSTAKVDITINYKNYPPVANDDEVITDEDEAVVIDVLANDTDPDEDVLTVSKKLIGKPRYGKLLLENNQYTYIPNANYNGQDSFEYEICDSGTPTICRTAKVSIVIDPVNDAPEPANDRYANKDVVPEIKGNVLENDYDIEGDNLFVALDRLVLPAHGELNMTGDGTFSYMPNPGFFGTDSFTYFACDDGVPSLCTKAEVLLDISSGVPKGFSPNNDGVNDVWVITGIEEYPGNTVVVFNRWGDVVFEINGYDNASKVWRGEANRGIKMSNGILPDGTYFYVINFGSEKQSEKGFIIIKR